MCHQLSLPTTHMTHRGEQAEPYNSPTLKYRRCRLGMGTGVGRPSPGMRVRGRAASPGSREGSKRCRAACEGVGVWGGGVLSKVRV